MKNRHNEGFTLLETLIAIVVLGIVVVPTCSAMIMSFRINAKAEQLLRDQLAVSSAVETLMSEGITSENLNDYGTFLGEDGTEGDRFPDVTIITKLSDNELYYDVMVTAGEVSVETQIRASGEGGTG